jgi:hypothetical protein
MSLQYQLINKPTGLPLAKSPYFMKISDGTTHFGYTDSEGMTANFVRKSALTAEIYVGDDALDMSEKE